jgi:PAS domain-containing protein
MPRFQALVRRDRILAASLRYGLAILFSTIAYAVVLGLEHLHVRDPYALIFLAAFWTSIWYAGEGPGNFALALSTLGLTIFLHSPSGWVHFSGYDLPVYLLFFVFAILIHRFSRMRRRFELSSAESRDRLEGEVRDRTAQLSHLNRQYKTILDALSLAVALFKPGRVIQVCNRAYETMLKCKPGELVGKTAPLPGREKETWKAQEDGLWAGKSIIDYEGPRLRLDGSEFPARFCHQVVSCMANACFEPLKGHCFTQVGIRSTSTWK